MNMGIWDYISLTADSIKRNAPDPTSVKSFCWSSYDHSRATVDKIYAYLPDAETQSKITTSLAKQTAHVAVREGVKLLPGGSMVYDIVSSSIPRGEKKSFTKEYKDELQAFKDKVGRTESEQEILKQELNYCRRLLEQQEMHYLIKEIKNKKAFHSNEKPEDSIRVFTTTAFSGKEYLDDLIAPGPGVTPKEY